MLRALTLATIVAALPFYAPKVRAQTAPLSQTTLPPQYGVPPRHRIEIHPGRPLYRRCTDWYELQNRPSGPVLYPQMRCWWVRG
ncbi:MAG TPA: hypothetical protein VH206_03990 [Xanthobacteraceae bacterium]|jgi:hypothetical protein|nr:hypothetical protein [Xanthobacteraceae bacterium]